MNKKHIKNVIINAAPDFIWKISENQESTFSLNSCRLDSFECFIQLF